MFWIGYPGERYFIMLIMEVWQHSIKISGLNSCKVLQASFYESY